MTPPLAAVPNAAWRLSGVATTGNVTILVVVVAIVGLWVGIVLWSRRRPADGPASKTALFDELCRAHTLSPQDRSLLRRAVGGGQPAAGFVDPGHLNRLAAASDADAEACTALSERLFGLAGFDRPRPVSR